MKIAFYLTPGRKKNLYCRINDGKERITFSLDYAVDPKTEWDEKKEMLQDENVHFFTLLSLRSHLTQKYHVLKTEGRVNALTILKNEAENLMGEEGLDGIAKMLFDLKNKELGVPAYQDFLKAFEKYSGLKREEYKVQPLDELIHFHAKKEVYVMDTYAGLHARLKGYIERESYAEIYTQTESWIWGEIYTDAGIEKHKFMPVMLSEWEGCWRKKYEEVKQSIGRTEHLDKFKEESWRAMQVFMACYNDTGNIIELAEEINEIELYTVAVITMLNIFDADTCYEEYCEHEFEQPDTWESISLHEDEDDNNDWTSPVFFIKSYEFQ